MRHKGLLITVLICLFVFVTSLVAGIVLTGTTVGWSEIGESIRTGALPAGFLDRLENWNVNFGIGRIGFTIDETRTDNLQGVTAIVVRGVSERITVTESGSQFTGRLSGSYVGMARLNFEVQREGSTLVVNTRHPWFGMRLANLALDLQIPASYSGSVEIRTVSGACNVNTGAGSAWNRFRYEGVSGPLLAANAVWPSIELESVSGTLRAEAVRGSISADTVSGRIEINYGTDTVPVSNLETVSGRITLGLGQQSRFSLLFTTVSGGLDSAQLPLQMTSQSNRRTEATYNGGGNLISAKTVSGGLSLMPAATASARRG